MLKIELMNILKKISSQKKKSKILTFFISYRRRESIEKTRNWLFIFILKPGINFKANF